MYLKFLPDGPADRLPPERGPRPLRVPGPRRDPVPIRIPRIPPGVKRQPIIPPGRNIPTRHYPLPRVPPRFMPGPLWLIPALVPLLWPRRAPRWNLPPNWVHKQDCFPMAPPYYAYTVAGHVINCLGGQAAAPTLIVPGVTPFGATSGNRTLFICVPDGSARWANRQVYHHTGTAPVPTDKWVRYDFATPIFPIDPNEFRFSPAPAPDVWPPANPAEPSPIPDVGPPVPWEWSNIPPGSPKPPWHTRQPPKPGTKENKSMSRAKRFGILAWNILDNVAELTEIADALFDALPEAEKAKCAKFGLNIGQYGSAMDTCKTKVLYENFDKMNPEQAFFNIAKMVAEDMTVGAFHKFLSKLTPPGFSIQKTVLTHFTSKVQFEAYIVKQLKKVWSFYGL